MTETPDAWLLAEYDDNADTPRWKRHTIRARPLAELIFDHRNADNCHLCKEKERHEAALLGRPNAGVSKVQFPGV